MTNAFKYEPIDATKKKSDAKGKPSDATVVAFKGKELNDVASSQTVIAPKPTLSVATSAAALARNAANLPEKKLNPSLVCFSIRISWDFI
jgi:hypothetical protein